MCATDIRPFSIMDGPGFQKLAQKLISIGVKHGNISVDDVLPSARTVSRHVHSEAEKKRAELKIELEKQKRFAVTTDLWTHEQTTMPYITVTVHYVNDNWEMRLFIVAMRSMEEKHTGNNIKSFTKEILEEMGAWRTDNYYVTDNGSNVKAAFKDQNWIPCCGHNLNLVLTHSLDGRDAPDSVLEIINLIGTCKDIVTRMKRSKIQHELQTTVKQLNS